MTTSSSREPRDVVAVAVVFGLFAFLLLMVQMGIISDCQYEPTCGTACQETCSSRHLWRWVITEVVLAAVAVAAVLKTRRRWTIPLVAATHVTAGVVLVLIR